MAGTKQLLLGEFPRRFPQCRDATCVDVVAADAEKYEVRTPNQISKINAAIITQRGRMFGLSEWLRKILGGPRKEPSLDLGDLIEGVTPHSHCERCGKAITLGKRFCSEVCKRGPGKGAASSFIWILLLMMLLMLLLGR